MPTITITVTAEQATRIQSAFNADAAGVKAAIIAYIKSVVRNAEAGVAEAAARATADAEVTPT